MSFGWSAGDIAECIKLLVKIVKAFKDSDGSAAEYQSAVDFLEGVERTVHGVEDIIQNNHLDLTFQTDFEIYATKLITAVTHFRNKMEGYDTSLGDNPTTSGAKKAWKKIKLALFAHIEELKSDILYPQSIVNNLIGLQALDILVDLSKKPTLSPQQFQDSTEEISREFPILKASIETLRSGIAEDLITIQQAVESNAQKNDRIQQDLSNGITLQQSSSLQAQADTETQNLWRGQVQISITEIRAEAQKHFQALEEVKQAQEIHHQHSMQTLQVFSWKNAFRPAISRPVIKVIKKTVIASSQPIRNTPATESGSPKRVYSQGGNSKGVSSRGSDGRGERGRGGSSRGGGPRRPNGQGERSIEGSSGATGSRGGGSNSRGGGSHRASSKRGSSRGGGNSRGDSTRGDNSRGGNSRGGKLKGPSFKGDSSRVNTSQGGSSKGNGVRGNGVRGGNVQGGTVRENSVRGGNVRGGSVRGGNARGGNVRGSNARGGSIRGGNARAGNGRGGSVRGGIVQGTVRGGKQND